MQEEIPCRCGGKMFPEDRALQFERIKKGLTDLFPYEKDERLDKFTKNHIGYGPNYMYRCNGCGKLIKFIPDGRLREYG